MNNEFKEALIMTDVQQEAMIDSDDESAYSRAEKVWAIAWEQARKQALGEAIAACVEQWCDCNNGGCDINETIIDCAQAIQRLTKEK